VGLPDQQLGEVMALVKECRVLCAVGYISILYSSFASPDPTIILKEVKLLLPLIVGYYHSLALTNPHIPDTGRLQDVTRCTAWPNPIQQVITELHHNGCDGE
jgi:hypothetical protein